MEQYCTIDKEIVFPIFELTDWVYEGERVWELEDTWSGPFHVRERDFEKHYNRHIIDVTGRVLKVSGKNIIGWEGMFWSFITPPKAIVYFDLLTTDKFMTLEEVKSIIASKCEENYMVYERELITAETLRDKINNAKSFEELFQEASFNTEEYDE